MTTIKHIIWDWNGTLLDDTWLCLDIMNRQLQNINKPTISYEDYQRLFDFPVKDFYEKIGFDFSIEPYETYAQNFIKEYARRRFECNLHFGVYAILNKLADFDCDHSILSAYGQDALIEMISHFKLEGCFSHIVGLDNHYASGKIEEGKILIEKLSPTRSDIILIGDTVHDYEVAKELGVECILIHHGHHSKLKLESCGVPVKSSFSEAILFIIK